MTLSLNYFVRKSFFEIFNLFFVLTVFDNGLHTVAFAKTAVTEKCNPTQVNATVVGAAVVARDDNMISVISTVVIYFSC